MEEKLESKYPFKDQNKHAFLQCYQYQEICVMSPRSKEAQNLQTHHKLQYKVGIHITNAE